MKKAEFVNKLAEYCEFENTGLKLETPLKSIEGYDSFAVMSMIAFADEFFGVRLTAQQISDLSDINSIIELIGINKFEND
jgi:acyl carrier protein